MCSEDRERFSDLFELNTLEADSIKQSLWVRVYLLDERRDAVNQETEDLRAEIDRFRRNFRQKNQIAAVRRAAEVDVQIAGEIEIIDEKMNLLFVRCQAVKEKLTTIQQEVTISANAALGIGYRPIVDPITNVALEQQT